MSTRDVAEDSLEDTLYSLDVGGDRWINERYPDHIDAAGVWHQGNLICPNGAVQVQVRGHARRAKHLFGYLYRHIADMRLQEMIFLQAHGDGHEAFNVLNAACSRDITNVELTTLNQVFDNSTIEADVGVTSDSVTLFGRHLNGINAQRPESMRKDDNNLTFACSTP